MSKSMSIGFPSGQASILQPWHRRGGITAHHDAVPTLYFSVSGGSPTLWFAGDEHPFLLVTRAYDSSNSALVGAVDTARSSPGALDYLRRAFGTDRIFVKVIETVHGPNLFSAEADHCAALSLLGSTVAPAFVHFYGTCRAVDVGAQRDAYAHHQALFLQAAEHRLSDVLPPSSSSSSFGAWAAATCHVLLGLHALAGYLGVTHGDAAMKNAVVVVQREPVVRHVVLVSGSPVAVQVPAIPLGGGRWGRVALIDVLVSPDVDVLEHARGNLEALQRLAFRRRSRSRSRSSGDRIGASAFEDLYEKMRSRPKDRASAVGRSRSSIEDARWKAAKRILDEAADFLSPGHPKIAEFLRRETLAISPGLHDPRRVSVIVDASDYDEVHDKLSPYERAPSVSRRTGAGAAGAVRVSEGHLTILLQHLKTESNHGKEHGFERVTGLLLDWRRRLDAEALRNDPRLMEPRDDAVLRMIQEIGGGIKDPVKGR